MNTQNTNNNQSPTQPKLWESSGLPEQKRFKLIACEIIYREMSLLAAQSKHLIDAEFLRKGLHDAGQETMHRTLQDAIDAVDKTQYHAVLLGYGLCNNGIVGLQTQTIPLIIPRAHDCITFFFGSRDRYEKYFSQNPGTYYRTTGWTERSTGDDDSLMHQMGLDSSFDEYVAKYGRENAEYIIQSLGTWEKNYKYLAYIDMQLPIDQEYARLTQEEARRKSMEFLHIEGSWRLLNDFVSGNWTEEDFLVVLPGQEVICENNDKIIKAINTPEKKS